MKDITKNIRQLRCAKNLTQDELAEKLFVTRQTVSNYENGKSRPDVEMLARIAEVLETDVNALIYGPSPDARRADRMRLVIGAALTFFFGLCNAIAMPVVKKYAVQTYNVGWLWLVQMLINPLFLLFAGWTLMQLAGMALKWKPLAQNWARWTAIALVVFLIIWILLSLWFLGAVVMNDYLYHNHIRGEWVESTVEYESGTETVLGWNMLPPPVPEWINRFVSWIAFHITEQNSYLFPLLGAALWYLGFPKRKEA